MNILIKKLNDILLKLYTQSEKPFSGVGILISNDISLLPISPLYDTKAEINDTDLLEQLLSLSNYNNLYHDGFHVLSTDLKITHSSQYFYPKPPKDFLLNVNSKHGVRYFVAKIGSTLPNIEYTAIVGGDYGVCIFKNGKIVKVKKDD
jgi:hypothetical protein